MSKILQPIVFIALFLLQILAVSLSVDARVLYQDNCTEVFCWLAFSGNAVKIVILTAVIACIVINRRLAIYVTEALNFPLSRRQIWMVLQIVAFVGFYFLSQQIFQTDGSADGRFLSYFWIFTGFLCGFFIVLSIAPAHFWIRFISAEKGPLIVSVLLASATFALSTLTADLWHPLSDATFFVSASFLELSGLDVIRIPEKRILGIESFIVNIAPSCSGYEGIGLITAFSSAYLYFFRKEFIFPRALILFPIGIICIWIFNAIRIALLIYIGHAWSPEVAIGGFHSQAGWISFIACALLVLWMAHSSNYYTKTADTNHLNSDSNSENSSTDTLIPVLVLLGSNLVIGAISLEFDYFYPVKAILVACAIAYVWKNLDLQLLERYLEPAIAACIVSAVWFLLAPVDDSYNQMFQSSLDQMSGIALTGWMVSRIVGSVLLIPIAEELGFRGYLLCKIDKKEVNLNAPIRPSILAIGASSLVFGALHNAWVAGTIAGVVFAMLRIRSGRISSAIFGHMLTNTILMCIAWIWGLWHLL